MVWKVECLMCGADRCANIVVSTSTQTHIRQNASSMPSLRCSCWNGWPGTQLKHWPIWKYIVCVPKRSSNFFLFCFATSLSLSHRWFNSFCFCFYFVVGAGSLFGADKRIRTIEWPFIVLQLSSSLFCHLPQIKPNGKNTFSNTNTHRTQRTDRVTKWYLMSVRQTANVGEWEKR